jgi:short-subunit dehydrogenase
VRESVNSFMSAISRIRLQKSFKSPLAFVSSSGVLIDLSLAALAPVPVVAGYSISKAAAFNLRQSLRALLTGQGVAVHAVLLGPVEGAVKSAGQARGQSSLFPR